MEAYHSGLSDGSIARVAAPTQHVWRYMDLWKLVSMLQHQALYFPVLAALGDEFEAARPRLPEGSTAIDENDAWRRWDMLRCMTFVSCWHCASTESAAMWEIYTGRNKGVAIRSTLSALSAAFRPAEGDEGPANLLKAGLVEYIHPEFEEPAPRRFDDNQDVLRKRIWYAYESELRVFCVNRRNWLEPSKEFEPSAYKAPGVWVECNLKTLITGITLAPKSPPFMESALREVLSRFGFDPELVHPSSMNTAVLPPNPIRVREEWMRRFKDHR